MTYAIKAIFNVKISRKERIPCYLYKSLYPYMFLIKNDNLVQYIR
jgi:hypothetical protein